MNFFQNNLFVFNVFTDPINVFLNDGVNLSLIFNEELVLTKYDAHSVSCINKLWFTKILS